MTDQTGVDYVVAGCYTNILTLILYKLNPVTRAIAYNTFSVAGGLVPQFNPIYGNTLILAEPTSFPSQNLSFAIWQFDLTSTPVGSRVASGLLPWPRGATGNNITSGTLSTDRLVFSYYDSKANKGLFVYSWPPASLRASAEATTEEELMKPYWSPMVIEEEEKKVFIEDEFGVGEKAPMAQYLMLLKIQPFASTAVPFIVYGTGDVGFVVQFEPHDILMTTVEYDLNYWYGQSTMIPAVTPAPNKYYSSVFGGQNVVAPCVYTAYLNGTGTTPSGWVINEVFAPFNRYARVQVVDTYVSEIQSLRGFAQRGWAMTFMSGNTIYLFTTTCY